VDGTSLSGIGVKRSDNTYAVGSATSEIQATVVPSTIYTLRNQGDLYVTKSSTPVKAKQLLGGALGDEILRLQFHAEYEDIDVTDLVFSGSGANAASIATNVDRLELYLVGATTPFATATVAGCGNVAVASNSMCANMDNREFIVPKGSNTNILVRPRMRTDVDGATAGHVVALKIDRTASTSTGAVRARGLLSSNDLAANDADATPEGEVFIGASSAGSNTLMVSNLNHVVLSKVTAITNADPNANGTAIPTGTQRDLGMFKFATAAASNLKNGTNKWTLSGVIFTVNATNVDLNSDTFKIYNTADPTQKRRCSVDQTSGSSSLLVTCQKLPTASGTVVINTEIDPGTDATFVLNADVQNAKVSNSATSTLQVSITGFETPSYTTFGSAAGHIAWLDKDNSNTTKFFWIDYPSTSINGTSYNG
jgi:hypothetical protein